MKKKVLLALVTVVLLLSIALSGCSSGIPQADYDNVAAQLADAQSKFTKAQNDLAALQAGKNAVAADLQAAQAEIADLEKQVSTLEVQVADLVAQYKLEIGRAHG